MGKAAATENTRTGIPSVAKSGKEEGQGTTKAVQENTVLDDWTRHIPFYLYMESLSIYL